MSLQTQSVEKSVIPQIEPSVIGWQGVRCLLPPDWNLSGFSMEYEEGYIRIDAPLEKAMTVQIRWLDASKQKQSFPSLYTYIAPKMRALLHKPDPPVTPPDLKATLDKMLKETEKQAQKEKMLFESNLKPEQREGEEGVRRSINFSWNGIGRGQGKIYHCTHCNRVVMAQVLAIGKDRSFIPEVASQLFATLQDHSIDGRNLWALYGLQIEIPENFRLTEQKVFSGHLRLVFHNKGEKIIVDRWGLADTVMKRLSLEDWFRNQTQTSLKNLELQQSALPSGHSLLFAKGPLGLLSKIQALRDSSGLPGRFASQYAGGVWECPETNRIYSVQYWHRTNNASLWDDLVQSCNCHSYDQEQE